MSFQAEQSSCLKDSILADFLLLDQIVPRDMLRFLLFMGDFLQETFEGQATYEMFFIPFTLYGDAFFIFREL